MIDHLTLRLLNDMLCLTDASRICLSLAFINTKWMIGWRWFCKYEGDIHIFQIMMMIYYEVYNSQKMFCVVYPRLIISLLLTLWSEGYILCFEIFIWTFWKISHRVICTIVQIYFFITHNSLQTQYIAYKNMHIM